MSLSWDWKDKLGEVDYLNSNGKTVTVNIYGGNALAIMVHKYEEDGEMYYTLAEFFCDEEHAKRCLGIAKGDYRNLDDDRWHEIRLDMSHPKARKLLPLIAKAKWPMGLTIKILPENKEDMNDAED